jgi:hypothetical protein
VQSEHVLCEAVLRIDVISWKQIRGFLPYFFSNKEQLENKLINCYGTISTVEEGVLEKNPVFPQIFTKLYHRLSVKGTMGIVTIVSSQTLKKIKIFV